MPAAVSSSDLAVDRDGAAIGPQQAGDHVDQRGLAGAGGAEQAGDAAFAGERGFDRELAELFCDVDAQHGQFPCRRCVARRANHSEAISAPIAMTIETTTSRSAAASPSGRLDQRIDRRRNGLGLAGNVRHEGDGRAEFADRLGKAEHHAGEHAGQRQRQRDGEEHPPGRCAQRARPPAPAGGRPPRSTAGSAAPAAETTSRRRRAPRRSSGTRTRCRDGRRATRRPGRAGRRSAAADSR